MKRTEIARGIYWVGAVDWNVRDFHGYSTQRGSTYNAYLVVDEKIALIDSVKHPFADVLLKRISEIVDLSKIDYVISNHTEPDHSSSLPVIMSKLKPGTPLYCSPNGAKGLKRHYKEDWNFVEVRTGDTLDLGSRSLSFLETPMLHWPDSMMTFDESTGVLFSMDGFGQHLATAQRYDDEVNYDVLMYEAGKYYSNILTLFARVAVKTLTRVKESGLLEKIRILAPSHGVIWRKHVGDIVQKYLDWSTGVADDRVLIIYDTMWKSTEKLALAMLEGVEREGMDAKLIRLTDNDKSDIMADVLSSKGLLIGSPTLNNNVFPKVAEFMIYMRGLRPLEKLGAAFGSYGWGGGATRFIKDEMEQAGIKVYEKDFRVKYVPDPEELVKAEEFGKEFARAVREMK